MARLPILPADPTPWDERVRDLCLRFPRAWATFCRLTIDRINRGSATVGAKAVWEDMRWEAHEAMRIHSEDWALDNNHTASFARIFMAAYPEYQVFKTRRRPTERRAA